MKIKNNNYTNVLILVSSILFLILGAIMYTKPDAVVIITTYIFGGVLIIIGMFKCVKNYIELKKDNNTKSNEMIMGIILAIIGIICIFLAGVVEALVRLVIGGWMIFTGINQLMNVLYMDKKIIKFWLLLILSLIIIGGGVYTILEVNLAFKAIGIILMIYAVLEIINYILNYNNKVIIKDQLIEKNSKVIEGQIIETKDEEKKEL